jgi:single-strand DNA-binding protein
MTDIITVRGYVATDVRLTLAQSGLPIAGFRMCSTERRFDKESNAWVDGHTNWYSVSMFRQLATNAGASIRKGDRVIVTGRLKIRPWINAEGRTGTSVEIDADTAGHDLMWGTANFRRTAADRTEAQPGVGTDEQPADIAGDHGVPDGVDATTGEMYGASSARASSDDDTGDRAEEGAAGGAGAGNRTEALEEASAPF